MVGGSVTRRGVKRFQYLSKLSGMAEIRSRRARMRLQTGLIGRPYRDEQEDYCFRAVTDTVQAEGQPETLRWSFAPAVVDVVRCFTPPRSR